MKIQNIISIIDKQSNKHFKADVGSRWHDINVWIKVVL